MRFRGSLNAVVIAATSCTGRQVKGSPAAGAPRPRGLRTAPRARSAARTLPPPALPPRAAGRGFRQGLRAAGLGSAAAERAAGTAGGRTLQERAALAVRGAPEPGRAVLAARQQALPVRAQAEPVDAPAVVGADPQGRPSAPHAAGGAGDEEAAPRYGGAPRHPRGGSRRRRPAAMTLRGTGCAEVRRGPRSRAARTASGPADQRRVGGGPRGPPAPAPAGGDAAPPASLPHAPPERAGPRSRDPRAEASPRAPEGSGLVAGSGGRGPPASRAPCGRAPRAGGGECGTIQAGLAPPQRPPPNLSPPTSPAGAPAPTPLPHPGTRRSGPSSARGRSALPGDAGDPRTCGCPRCPVRPPKAGTRRGRWTQGRVG